MSIQIFPTTEPLVKFLHDELAVTGAGLQGFLHLPAGTQVHTASGSTFNVYWRSDRWVLRRTDQRRQVSEGSFEHIVLVTLEHGATYLVGVTLAEVVDGKVLWSSRVSEVKYLPAGEYLPA